MPLCLEELLQVIAKIPTTRCASVKPEAAAFLFWRLRQKTQLPYRDDERLLAVDRLYNQHYACSWNRRKNTVDYRLPLSQVLAVS
jgi:hypothetical protein